jgi:Tfp pilus assembly protein PilN
LASRVFSLAELETLGCEDFSVVKVNLNLASKPYNNRVLPWVLTFAILFVSLVGLIFVVQLTTSARSKTAKAEAELNIQKQTELSLLNKAEAVKKSFTVPQQQALLAAHQLIDRKAFSWSRLLADLEASLPGSVRVSSIAVRGVTTQGTQTIADLDLVVFSKTADTVIEMIAAMNHEGVFHAYLQSQNLQKGRGEGGTEYELKVVYKPRAGYANESIAEVRQQSASTGEAK